MTKIGSANSFLRIKKLFSFNNLLTKFSFWKIGDNMSISLLSLYIFKLDLITKNKKSYKLLAKI